MIAGIISLAVVLVVLIVAAALCKIAAEDKPYRPMPEQIKSCFNCAHYDPDEDLCDECEVCVRGCNWRKRDE